MVYFHTGWSWLTLVVARIAGFNLALFRGFIPLGSGQTKIRVRPCVSGSHHNRPNRRCIANLTRVATQAAPFKIKVVVSAADRDGHKEYAKRFLKVKP